MPEDFKENFSPDTQMLNDLIDSVHKEALKDPDGYGIAGSLSRTRRTTRRWTIRALPQKAERRAAGFPSRFAACF